MGDHVRRSLLRHVFMLMMLHGAAIWGFSSWEARGQGPLSPTQSGRRGELFPTPAPTPHQPVPLSHFSEAWRAPLGSALSGALVATSQQIFATLESGSVVALAPDDGHTIWKQELGAKPVGGPVLSGSVMVQAGQEGEVAAWSLDGKEAWRENLADPILHPPTGTRESVLLTLASSKLVSLHIDGSQQWSADLLSPASAPPAACRGFVVVGTEKGTVEAFARDTGKSLWVAKTGAAVVSPFLCYRGAIYFGTADNRMWALKYSGRKMWRYPAGARCAARPFGLGERVYFPSFDNYIYCLNAGSGNLVLRVRLSHRLLDDMLVGDDRLYVSPFTSGRLSSLSLPDLIMAGEYRLDLEGDWFTSAPVRAGDLLCIGYGRYEGRVLALKETLEEPQAGTDRP